MSTVVDKAPAVTAPERTGRHPAAAVLALARFEARELLLRIPVFVVFLLYIGSSLWSLFFSGDGMDDYPVLQNIDRAHQAGLPFMGVAVLMCTNFAALRSRRQGTDRLFDVLPMEPWRRTVAHALSVVPLAAVTALVVAVQFGWAAMKPGAVGHGSVAELAVGPLVVLLAGVLGVLIARICPRVAGGPVFVVVGFAALMVAAEVTGEKQHWLNWLHPIVSENGADPVPSDLLGRPAAWHALYLVGLVALLLCAAVLLSGGRTRLMAALTVVAFAATAVGIAGQSPGHAAALTASRTQMTRTPARFQSCVTHGRSTYCSFPEWTGRRDDWARVVDRVQRLAGGGAGGAGLTIRQRIPVIYDLNGDAALRPLRTPGVVSAGTRWGGNRVPEFAVGVASVLVAGDEQTASEMCDARVVTVMWLALAAQDDPEAAFREVRLDDATEGSGLVLAPTEPVAMSAEQTRIVRELLNQPRYSVTARMKAHWTELMSPETSEARVAELLGVPAADRGTGQAADKGASCER
ncbi:ABC transporter permease [Streptomyces gibsoniae]|uniref:ABC transporter permease n=1 Tax=Streptomyces gibsoniae TaxID=3075529 RepID=A0ABU2TR94_9ACTN|nr:ABC transporter permease [Streptomyces sp. DSM 41699]MDT0463469.1 ABC transporter permease [Streptomyces sp. DSM 41699]